ncbi:thioredoxin family protein [Paenibacillus sp. FSL F4-0122]|uniref:thioredoxin family protein n=1 Tax=Paenibacillus TaxID=44249 RepID=UPI00096D67B1|nr:thioredoxin family protein [Paenibacillus odorifer]OME44205.1 thiol reductase thioredoxin [Paenibacillus odorifer]OZQ77362.1 thiol reductase thioredoxin [Paenibacillus odorifer]
MKEVYELTTLREIENFLKDYELSFLYISKPDCSICHALLPKLKELLSHYPIIRLGHIDASKVEEVAGKFLILSAPMMLLFIEQKEYLREDRFVRLSLLKEKLDYIYQIYNE